MNDQKNARGLPIHPVDQFDSFLSTHQQYLDTVKMYDTVAEQLDANDKKVFHSLIEQLRSNAIDDNDYND